MTHEPSKEAHMSTHADPSKDEYLELEKKLGAAEYDLAANLADADTALDAHAERRENKLSAARAHLKRKLVRARFLSHQ
jgi:hypothetical protein